MRRRRGLQWPQQLSKRRSSRLSSQALHFGLNRSSSLPCRSSSRTHSEPTENGDFNTVSQSEVLLKSSADSTSIASKELLDVSGKTTPSCLRLKSKVPPGAHKVPAKPCQLPESNVLQRVKSFLPMMHEADVKLQEDLKSLPAGSLDIENVDDVPGHLVAMDMMLFEHPSSDSDSDDEKFSVASDSASSSAEELNFAGCPVTEENFRLAKPRAKHQHTPLVEVLHEEL